MFPQRLMASHASADLSSSILDFQAHLMRITYLRKITPVDVDQPTVQSILAYVWMAARLGHGGRSDKVTFEGEQWMLLGCPTGNIRSDFAQVGILGLDCLVRTSCLLYSSAASLSVFPQRTFVQSDLEHFAKVG
jgi:engulfment/cell motility protein 1